MVSKKLKEKILAALVIGYIAAPPVIHAQNPISVDSQEIDVESRESNEDFLNYLELTDEFVLSAERIPTNRWDTPANVTVISAKEIENNHYQTVIEALNHVNGVLITSYGRSDTNGFVSLNGSNRVLLLIDGHRANVNQDPSVGSGFLYYQTGGMCDLSMIPSIKVVDRIEIIKGGASALYGSDAVGGIINVITKKGERDETEVDVNYGSWHQYNLEATNQGVKGKLSWFVTAGFGKSDGDEGHYGLNGLVQPQYKYTDYKDRDLSIRLDDKFNDRNSLTVSYMHRSHDFYDKASTVLSLNTGTLYDMYNTSSIEYHFKEDTSTPGWIRYFNNYQKGTNFNTYSSDDIFVTYKLQGLEYQNGWEFGRHKLIAGVEWHRLDAESLEYNIDNKRDNVASYVQDTISLGNKWTLVPGLRYDHDKDFGGNWSPKIATNYRADDKTKVYASWGRTYTLPTLGELYTERIFTDEYGITSIELGGAYSDTAGILANYVSYYHPAIAELIPSKGHSETIGVEHDFDDRTVASLSFFNNKVDNAVNWYETDLNLLSYNAFMTYSNNDLTQKRRGLELAFEQNLSDRWSYDLGYSHTHTENIVSGVKTNFHGLPNIYRIGIHYNLGKWRANLLGVMASSLDERYFPSDKYAVLDFNTSYDFTDRTSVYFRVLNFTDEEYSNNVDICPAPGRFIQIGATYKF